MELGKVALIEKSSQVEAAPVSSFCASLTGAIPPSIGYSCRRLEYLELAQNELTDSVPSSLGNCSSLVMLDLSENSLSQGIPPELGRLKRLEYLSFSVNKLMTGNIPPTLGNCTSLKELALDTNQFTGSIPRELGSLMNLEGLYLFQNNLTGPIPDSVGNCTKLKYLLLGENKLNGSLPETLGRLKQLEKLHLQRNVFISGEVPWSALSNCSKLSQFVAMRNSLKGTIAIDLGAAFPSLTWLDFSRNHLSGPFPSSILNCTQLELLRLYWNNFTGELDVDLSKLPNLRTLHLSTNKFSGTLAKLNLRNATNLEYLDLSNNSLTGSIPDYSSSDTILPSMKILTFRSNHLSGEIPDWMWKLPKLQVLDLSRNNFSGALPSDWTRLVALTNSSITGTKKPDISDGNPLRTVTYEQTLVTLKNRPLDETYIFGYYTIIDLSNNSLVGVIPQGVEELQGLRALYLTGNNLNGEIPVSLVQMKNLGILDLSVNQLSGDITEFASRLEQRSPAMEYVNVSYNSLTGRVETTVFGMEYWLPNAGLCGRLLRPCSTAEAAGPGEYHDTADDGTSFLELVSIVAFEIGVSIGALLVGVSCLASRRLRTAWFYFPKKRYRQVWPNYIRNRQRPLPLRWEGRSETSSSPETLSLGGDYSRSPSPRS
ncbi:hypothetical protein R1sor_022137 [Riccia sorocarpa]|uniref:Leucine-rich repeat receptor-like protein kinase n=1 Tax=Riccia sorocarpa TaxID=122646 RepID=A0ABD3GMT6_9MARC